jgi:hypothetical protein
MVIALHCIALGMKGPQLGANHHTDMVYVMYSVVLYKEEFVLFFKKNVKILCT